MYRIITLLIVVVFASISFADDGDKEHGMYMLTVKNLQGDFNETINTVKSSLQSTGFEIIGERDISTPDIVREDGKDICGFKGKLFVFSSSDFTKMLTSFGNKYLAASFLRVGIHQTNEGIQIIIADPETINRIIFNDLNDEQYQDAINKTLPFKKKIIAALHKLNNGSKVKEVREPKRTAEELRDADRDMFMMVGPMTFFEDEDQFPVIYSQKNNNGSAGIDELKQMMYNNIKSFKPNQDDKEYRWTKNPATDLKWKVIGEIYSPDKNAVMFGLTRNRTEAVSFYIVGDETDENKCPGLDHLTAFPIEVMLIQDGDEIKVHSCREMFRMDMYFWDAGMGAFMDHMGMPGMLDESIYLALFGKEKD
jgi:hypothetical protein